MTTAVPSYRTGSTGYSAAAVLRVRRTVPSTLEEFIEQASCVDSVPELIELYGNALLQFDYENFALVQLPAPTGPDTAARGPGPIPPMAARSSEVWISHYAEQGYAEVDPVLRIARGAIAPYEWQKVETLSREERRVMNEASDVGLKNGLCIPIHEPHGRVFLASMATSRPKSDSKHTLAVVHLLTVHFHCRLRQLQSSQCAETPSAQLTSRERECLLWTARGKSSWDIGRVLGISEHTVNFHVKNAMSKLGTSSRVSAVVKCVSLGLIAP